MIKVRKRDLALVAFAGGLLAFELVSLTEVLPGVKQALADRGLSAKSWVASAGAAGVPALTHETAVSAASRAIVGAATGHAHKLVVETSVTGTGRIGAIRAERAPRAPGRRHVVTVKHEGPCPAGTVAVSRERLREVEKAVDLALKQATL